MNTGMNTYLVTIIWRGSEICLEVEAEDVSDARKTALAISPGAKIISVERQHAYS